MNLDNSIKYYRPFLFLVFLLSSFKAVAAESLVRVTDSLSATESGLLVLDLPEGTFEPASLFDLSNKTLRATPNGNGYNIEISTSQFVDNIGESVNYWEGPIEIDSFQFEFSNTEWDSFYINADNTVSFGVRDDTYSAFSPYIDTSNELSSAAKPPLIAPLFRLWTSGEVSVSQSIDQIVITWNVTPYNLQDSADIFAYIATPEINTFQLVLFESGVIEMNYKDLTIDDGIVGILPAKVSVQLQQSDLLGTYIRQPVENSFHEGEIFTDMGVLKWRNFAGVEWELNSDNLVEKQLATIGSPYGDTLETIFTIETCDDGAVRGFLFFNELYTLSSSQPCGGGSINFDSLSKSEIILRPYEVFHYTTPFRLESLGCSFIPAMGDNYDFILGFTPFRLDKPLVGSGMNILRNSIDGIGVSTIEANSSDSCSENRLQAAPVFPWYFDSPLGEGASPDGLDESYDFFLSMAGHELTHRWIASVDAIVDGRLIELQDDSCNCHWIEGLHAPAAHPWKEDMQASPMGGGYWVDNNNGTFTRVADAYFVPASGLSYLDLYLMGLVPAEEVPDFFLIDNLTLINSNDPDRPIYSGNRIDITIEDVIASAGPRSISSIDSQKDFNTAFVHILEPGSALDPEQLNRLATISDKFSEYWSFVTGGVSSMNFSLSTPIQEASFGLITNILSIPVLKVGSDHFSLELSLSKLEPVEFQQLSYQQIDASATIATSTLEDGVVLIPGLVVGETKYRIELSLISENPILLRLTSAAEL
ncbi:MAG: hypothetical protein ACI8XU_002463 [Kiritimatiellia bacterium]|jgi:hypothetical protein